MKIVERFRQALRFRKTVSTKTTPDVRIAFRNRSTINDLSGGFMSTIVEKILREIAEGKIEVDDGEWYRVFYPVGLPLYLDVIERPISAPTSVTVS